jgi:CHAT domain-containing protein
MHRPFVATLTLLLLVSSCSKRDTDPMTRLIESAGESRTVEARLSGVPWAPLQRTASGRDAYRLHLAAREVIVDIPKRQTPEARRTVAMAYLLSNDSKRAIATLSALTRSTPDARSWNDLAAAHYTAGVASSRMSELIDALTDVDTALRFGPRLTEALFNRALILEHIGLRASACNAWKNYLDRDSTSRWAVEARPRLAALSRTEPPFREIFLRDYDRFAVSADAAHDLARRYPQETRTWGETEVLGRWAEAFRNEDAVAERHLRLARELGVQLAHNGDRMLQRAVDAIETANGSRRDALASGHLDFRLGQKTYQQGRLADAESILRRAAAAFDTGRSPIAHLARYFAANAAYDQGRVHEATTQLESLLTSLPADFPAARAQIQWQLALCRGANARWGDALQIFGEARTTFEQLGERGNAAKMTEFTAEVDEMIGDTEAAWNYRTSALPQLGRETTPLLQAIFGVLSQAAVLRRDWQTAGSFANLEIEACETLKNPAELADALLRRALVRQRLHDAGATADAEAARDLIARLPDQGLRSRLNARRMAIEGMISTQPLEAVRLLSKAIDFHQGSGGQRMFLPLLLLHRARAYRGTGDTTLALADLDSAIAEIESHRQSLLDLDKRWSVFESADAIFEDAINLALSKHDDSAAFAYAERGRARALLESMPGDWSASTTRVPAGTAIVEYAVLTGRIVTFVVDHRGIRAATSDVDREELDTRATSFTAAVGRGDDTRAVGRSLYRDLFDPVAPLIDMEQTLVIVPDATLSRLPFAALIGPDNRFLIEQHQIVVAPSAAVYERASKRHDTNPGPRKLLMVMNGDATGVLDPLPEARAEASAISRMYRDVSLLSGASATPSAFEREAPRANIIHFTGHALTSEISTNESSLILAGGEAARLTTSQIAAIRLDHCSTVILAACGTARGKVTRFEGTLSVARAFLAAGSPSVVATLWPIDDAQAARFFPRIHERLVRGATPAEALRAAQIEWIRRSESPAIWAAVQAIGS